MDVFIKRYNDRFAVEPAEQGSSFKKISSRDIKHMASFAYEAVVGNDNCVRLGGICI